MTRTPQRSTRPPLGPPSLPPDQQRVLIVLFVLYAAELAARSVLQLPVDRLVWWPGNTFAPWQLLTHWFIQGNEPIWVLISGVVLAMLLPVLQTLSRRQAIEAAASSALGAVTLAGLVQLSGVAATPAFGWSVAVTALLVLFGLQQPNAVVNLFFVLPVPAWVFVWGAAALTFLNLLAAPGLGAAEQLGAVGGMAAWFHSRGPGGRRRELKKKAASVEQQLRGLRVIQGGRDQNRDDEVWH